MTAYYSLPNLQRISFPKMQVQVADSDALRGIMAAAEREALEQGASKDEAAATGLQARDAHIDRSVTAATDAMTSVIGDQLVERGLAIRIDALAADVVFHDDRVDVNVRSADLITTADTMTDTTQDLHVHVEVHPTIAAPPREVTFQRDHMGGLVGATVEDV